jgi:hypothetical protein
MLIESHPQQVAADQRDLPKICGKFASKFMAFLALSR